MLSWFPGLLTGMQHRGHEVEVLVVVLVKLPCLLCDVVQSGINLLTFLNTSTSAKEMSVNAYHTTGHRTP
jgi:hypothetical protein